MSMVCPKCGEDYEQRLQCPRCHVRLAFEPRSRPEVIENPWARRDQWQNTYWGRVLVGLLLAQGLYYGLRQLLTAGLMASGDDGAKDVWTTLFGLVLGQALQAFGLLAGAVLTGAGQRRAFVLGAMVGAWNGILFVVMQRLHATILTPVALYGLPLLQIAFGAIGGTVGGLIWRPSPTLTAPVAPAPAAAATSALALRGRKWSLFDGPTAWGRVLLGVAVAVSGAIWSRVILDFVLESAHGRLSIESHLQARLITWEIIGLALLTGGAVAGAGAFNGLKQGLFMALGTCGALIGIRLGMGSAQLEEMVFTSLLGLAFGLLGGWFGGQLLPPVYGSLRPKKFSELTF